jgi:type I restriction enzyme M protein
MRNSAGLQPQEAFDELLKYLFFKQLNEERGPIIEVQMELMQNGSYSKCQKKTVIRIRKLFAEYLRTVNVWSTQIWTDKKFHLNDEVLFSLHDLFKDIRFGSIPFDIRSTALKEFVSPEIRRGLGIYLTPDDVVRMMVNIVAPKEGTQIYDIAVGSGTFLREVLHFWLTKEANGKHHIWGTDINPRMLFLSDLNLGHMGDCIFHKRMIDALDINQIEKGEWPRPNSFDYIFTNPPFGVVLDNNNCDLSKFATCKNSNGAILDKQQSEVVFVEQSLRFLKPGGILSIVLPRSLATNLTLGTAREVLGSFGYIYALVILPSETFQTAGTQTTTVVLFIRKYLESEERAQKVKIGLSKVANVGYDSTGRVKEGNQLPTLPQELLSALSKNKDSERWSLLEVQKDKTFIELPNLLSRRRNVTGGTRLSDVLELACTGRTPARSHYTDKGLFLIKVGNLTGNGIKWASRDRNFVDEKESAKRIRCEGIMLKKYDILLTSSAHSPVYIAKKVDIVWRIPDWLGRKASFVGEVMLLRPKMEVVEPFVLLAYLRMDTTGQEIRAMIRGQTAHLHPRDLLWLMVPPEILKPDESLKKLAENLRKEAILNEERNKLIHEDEELLQRVNEGFDLLVNSD